MSDAGNILPQAEIDALFKQATGRSLSTPPEVEAAKIVALKEEQPVPKPVPSKEPVKNKAVPGTQTPKPVVTQPDTETLNKVLNKLMDTIETLTRRIETIEQELGDISKEKNNIPDYSEAINKLTNKMQSNFNSIQQLNTQIIKQKKQLKGTPGFAARDKFVCSTCGSHGYLAVPMKCSNCGTEGWWGWYPEKK